MTRIAFRLLIALAACAVVGAPLAASEPLPQDPNNVYGKLDNGLGYIVRQHDNPPGRVSLYLHVKSGALNETGTQNGLAHFLEHMAFNGSEHYPPGELVPYLNSLGMQFGADTNAHTNLQETVYKLHMPDNDTETIHKAMEIFADYAFGLKLLEEEIDKERKVILEEARRGKSAQERLQKKFREAVFAGSKIAVHDVIGDDDQIAGFPREEFVDYWNTWYRPDLMTLIVVGDVDPEVVIKKAKSFFSEFAARASAREEQGTGIKPVNQPRAFVFTDEEMTMCQVQVLGIKEGRPPMKTYADYRHNEIENIGPWIVNRRLQDLQAAGDADFRFAFVGVQGMLNDAILPMGIAMGMPADWNRMLEQVITEIDRALEHGFTERELALARKNLVARAERAVETESTRNARAILGQISSEVGNEFPILSAEQRLDLTRRVVEEATLAEVEKIFRQNYDTKNYNYVLNVPDPSDTFKPPTPEELLAAAGEVWARKTEAAGAKADAEDLLAALPEPGKVESKSTDDDLKVTTATLANGAVVHYMYSDYKKDQASIRIILPGGELEETAADRGISDVASLVFGQPATRRLDSTQIRDLMTGKKVGVSGSIGRDALTVSISGSPRELETGMQLAYALMTDGKIEPSALDNWKKLRLQALEQQEKTPGGQLRKLMDEVFYAGDIRLSRLTAEQVERQTIEPAEKWLRRIVRTAPIEVGVVGDISEDQAMKLVVQYVGGLPKRAADFDLLDTYRTLDRASGPYVGSRKFASITPKAQVSAGFVGCNVTDVEDRRVLDLVAMVISDRMIKRIREDEQLVYSIRCLNIPSATMPGIGMVMASSTTDPENGQKLAGTIIEMMKTFAKVGPTAEELKVAQIQKAKALETSMKEPRFWLGQIEDLHYRDRTLAELKALPGVYDTFTADQLQKVAKKYFTEDRMFKLVVVPEKVVDAPEKETTAKAEEPEPIKG